MFKKPASIHIFDKKKPEILTTVTYFFDLDFEAPRPSSDGCLGLLLGIGHVPIWTIRVCVRVEFCLARSSHLFTDSGPPCGGLPAGASPDGVASLRRSDFGGRRCGFRGYHFGGRGLQGHRLCFLSRPSRALPPRTSSPSRAFRGRTLGPTRASSQGPPRLLRAPVACRASEPWF